jgi:hypothetical protein
MGRSQRHRREFEGRSSDDVQSSWMKAPVLSAVAPNTAANGATLAIAALTINASTATFQSGDKIRYRGVDYAATLISPTQIKNAVTIPVGTAGAQTFQVKRANGTLSNSLAFTVT